ncbi:DNA-binding protein [Streptomyces sp. NPDC049555]|uniref:DNA-binding protein n=1 Tax=Streptomyces sp. NPDC049555 TaxID=3154930 RepID=UPI00342190E5
MDNRESTNTPFRPEDPDQTRARREHLALARIRERFGGPCEGGQDPQAGPGPTAQEAVALVSALAGGTAGPGRTPAVDTTDLLAALTLLPRARAELDALEAGLMFLAREAGMTWAEIAFGLGLRSAQAAQQRCGRSLGRRDDSRKDESRDDSRTRG